MHIGVISLLVFITIIDAVAKRPEFPVAELCELYRNRCEKKLKKANCKERAIECIDYAENGLRVTWSFCMFMNGDNEAICRDRSLIDYEIIKGAVMNDTFKYDFAD